jgi:Na+/melibiose symporter-like transporter
MNDSSPAPGSAASTSLTDTVLADAALAQEATAETAMGDTAMAGAEFVRTTRDDAAAAADDQEPPDGAGGGVFANRDFVKLWAGESVSLIGTEVTQFAMPLVAILTLNASVLQVGVLNALRFVPVIILSLFAGVWLDRRRRRPVLIGCALGNAVLIGLVPLSSVAGLLSIGLLYVIVTLTGALSMTYDVGSMSYVPALVERRHLPQGNGAIQASSSFAGVAGPGLAGFLVGLITAPITLTVDAVSYLFVVAGLLTIKRREPEPEPVPQDTTVWRSVSEGLRAVYGNSMLRTLLSQGTVMNLSFGIFITVFVVYAIRTLGLHPLELGIVMASAAVGSLVGATLTGRITRALGLGATMKITVILVSASPFLMLIPRHASLLAISVLAFSQLLSGCTVTINNVNAITIRQLVTPSRLMARMNATYRMQLFGAAPLGMIAGGLLGTAFGLRTGLIIAVIGMAIPVVWIFFSPVYRLKELPAGAE